MKKKSFKKTGGNNLLKSVIGNIAGPIIVDNIKNVVELGKKKELLDEYKLKKDDAEKNYTRITDLYNKEQISNDKGKYLSWLKTTVTYPIYIYQIWNTFKSILSGLWELIKYSITLIKEFGGLLLKGLGKLIHILFDSQGALLSVLIFIIILVIIILAILGFFNNKENKFDYNKSYNSIKNNISLSKPSPYSLLGEQISNIVPEKYRLQFNNFRNSFNKLFGNDLIGTSINNQIRDTISNGRYDSIYHIKKNENETKIYLITQPNNIKLNIDINNYPDSDYFKLPEDLRKIYNPKNNTITIPPSINNTNGKYIYKFENAYYGSNIENKVNINNSPFIDIQTNNENYYKANNIPIDDFIFSDKDNINPSILKEKMFSFENGKYVYPVDYINKKIN